jgi:sensor c-di-GMP phosphodiesterase-like protein
MRTRRIIALAVVTSIAGAVLAMAGATYFSWVFAARSASNELSRVANLMLERRADVVAQATMVLHEIGATRLSPCSPAHIDAMRRLSFNSRSVEEIGYFEDGLLKCTSWGATLAIIEQPLPDFRTPDGFAVTVALLPLVTRGNRMVAIQLGNYNVLVDPQRLVDVVLVPDISLALIDASGKLISAAHSPDPELVGWVLLNPGQGERDGMLYATAEARGWVAIAMEPTSIVLGNLGGAMLVVLPFGALLAAGLVAMIIWQSRRRLSPEAELGRAVKRREFVVEYQPIVSLKSGACVGAEALVRWKLPNGTMVPPDHFIPLAEKTGLILPITDLVIESVITDVGPTLVEHRSLHVSINFAADDIKTGRMLRVLNTALASTGIEPRQIWLEATERGFMDVAEARGTLSSSREMGFFAAIDDFGTGYSSLQYLQGLPLDALKLDKSFVDAISAGTSNGSVTPHIIGMAKAMGLYIIAEGIERQEQATYLARRGVDFGQGWLFSKALPPKEFIAYFDRHRPIVEVRADRRSGNETDVAVNG